ncbi:hypothetical protein E9840_03000 [Tissierella creatinini]|nr:hypothetical protein E9840_03000 [Tissierella creatinini]TJX67250.1 hypothetical protein E8P77_05585 [Soehngenia saccharolytica]
MVKNKILIFLILIVIGSMILLSCTKETSSVPITEIFTNEDLNFSVEIPKQWEGKFIAEDYEKGVNFYSKNNKDYGGLLCSIERLVGELISQEDLDQAPVSQKILLKDNGYTYILRMPSDVQFALDNNKLKKEYGEMQALVNDMASSIKTINDSRPVPKVEGYKVIGTSFFTLEIPEDWDVKTTEDYDLRWEIYSEENIVGDIELFPYKSLYEGPYIETDLNKLLVDDELQRKARIYLNDEDGYKEIMQNITLTFEFTPSPFTVLDVEAAAVEYINGGGKKVFGQIENIEIVDGTPKSITIKAKEFIPDDSADSGFYIKDLGLKEVYSLENGVIMAPLMPPNYNSFEAYGIYNMDNEFIQTYENLYNMHYDFIIGADKQLKIIMGFYLP